MEKIISYLVIVADVVIGAQAIIFLVDAPASLIYKILWIWLIVSGVFYWVQYEIKKLRKQPPQARAG